MTVLCGLKCRERGRFLVVCLVGEREVRSVCSGLGLCGEALVEVEL